MDVQQIVSLAIPSRNAMFALPDMESKIHSAKNVQQIVIVAVFQHLVILVQQLTLGTLGNVLQIVLIKRSF